MRPTDQDQQSPAGMVAPPWSEVLRALREARGATQEGWGARLAVSRKTVQRWENGERVPDPGAEAAILAYCQEMGLFRPYARGPLAGLSLTPELLQELLAQARWQAVGSPGASPPALAPPLARTAGGPGTAPGPEASNLPEQLTSFVGRERELATVRRVQAGTRLLTLSGAGGCGKTRLALALADELLYAYPHGVWFVDLAPLSDPALAAEAVTTALQLSTTGQQPLVETLIAVLKERHLLLIMDNCEHLLPDCAALVEALLRSCPHLEVIATSRGSLGITGETIWRVPPLALPTGTGDAAESDAVRLFVERARLQRPELALAPSEAAAVAEICRQLDGMPLAIELAAARVNVLSVVQIAERLQDRFRLLAGSGRMTLPRHQTLRAAMDWSYDLLTAQEQALLRQLSVFTGGFTLEAAEAVCGGRKEERDEDGRSFVLRPPSSVLDPLTQLVDQSLVIADAHDGSRRYRMLETVRQYAAARLEQAQEAAAARERHFRWCLALAESAEVQMYGPREAAYFARLEREHDNLRAALAWAVAEGRRVEAQALRLAGALQRFWEVHGQVSEGRRWLSQLLRAVSQEATTGRVKALYGAGLLAYSQGDSPAARTLLDECLGAATTLGDEVHVAGARAYLGKIALRSGDYVMARAFLEAALALGDRLGNDLIVAVTQTSLGQLALRQGDYERARARFDAGLALNREIGNKLGIAGVLNDLATLASDVGDDEGQVQALEECLALYQELRHKSGIALVLGDYGIRAWIRREYDRATALIDESLALYQELGERPGIARLLGYQSLMALYRREYARAIALSRACLTLYREVEDIWAIGRYLPVLAGALFGLGQAERAACLYAAAAAVRDRLGAPLPLAVRDAHDHAIKAVRANLGEPAFAAAWTSGQALSWDAAVDMALRATDSV